MHTTNYVDTFIEVAEDCPVTTAEVPQTKRDTKSVARLQYELMAEAPYHHTSDDIIFTVHAERSGIPEAGRAAARERFFAKGQPCLRTSPLAKRYGWGIHSDVAGRVALVPIDSDDYRQLAGDLKTRHLTAMRSKRA